MSTEREESFGGVVVHDGNVLVITPAGRPQIATLPKGGPQEGEPPEATSGVRGRARRGTRACRRGRGRPVRRDVRRVRGARPGPQGRILVHSFRYQLLQLVIVHQA